MKGLLKGVLLGAVTVFLTVFMLLPMVSLFLVGFTGEPVNILKYLSELDFLGLLKDVQDHASLQYYAEFFETRRYRQGFLNALGVAPLAAVLCFVLAQAGLFLLGFAAPAPAARWKRFAGFPLMIAVFLGVVLIAVSWKAFLPADHWLKLLLPGKDWQTRLLQSLGFCPLVTLAATTIGVTMAFAITRTAMPLRSFVRMLCIVPLAVPPFLGALAFKNLLGDSGIFTRLLEMVHMTSPVEAQSALAAGIVQTFLFFPFVLLTTSAALDRMDPSLGEAAEVLGARHSFALWTVHLPVLMPGITAGAFLAFIRSFDDFAALSLLMPVKYPMIVVEAYRDLSGSTYWGGASMLSTVMVVTILSILALQKYFVERGSYETMTGKGVGGGKLVSNPILCWTAFAFCALVLSVPFLFVAATILVSLSASWGVELLPTAYTVSRYTEIVERLFQANSPLFNSFAMVLPGLLGAMFLALIVAYSISRSRHWSRHLLDFVTVLPFVVPGVAFAVALIGLFNGPPLALHLTVTLVICAYVVTRMPYGVRSTLASFQQIGTSMEESSKTLGGTSSLTMAKVTVPLVLPGLLAGAIMVFISAMQDVAITLMTCPPNWYPASVYVFHQIQQGDVFNASAYGMVLLGLILIPYALAFRLGAVRTSL